MEDYVEPVSASGILQKRELCGLSVPLVASQELNSLWLVTQLA